MKKILALVLALAMVATLGLAFADTGTYPNVINTHTITIDNTDQNVAHSYEAYQVFKGNLNADEGTLSDIDWGNGVKGDELLAALKRDGTIGTYFANCSTAADVAKVLGTDNFVSTSGLNQSSGNIDKVASIIYDHLGTKAADFTANDGGTYTADVAGDGYYFIKDTTDEATLSPTTGNKADTRSKYLLSVFKTTTIYAKDTGVTTDKEIVSDTNAKGESNDINADDNNVAIGDTVTYKITLDKIPNTAKYNVFKLAMQDNLDAGLTFTGITGIAAYNGDTKVADFAFNTDYKFTVKDNDGTATYDGTNTYEAPTDPVDTQAPKGGQEILVTFKNFKAKAENASNNLIGKKLVITYTAVLNKNATYGETKPNENTEKFIFSNNPNYDYDGDDFGDKDPTGNTPESTTRTYSTTLKIMKKAETTDGANLAGAVFELKGTNILNYTRNTGIEYVRTSDVGDRTPADDGIYYLLKDGSYTTTVPGGTVNTTQYEDTTTTYKKVVLDNVVTDAGDDYIETLTSGNDGIILFKGLRAGEYKLKEIQAPDGYNLDSTEYTLKIKWTKDGGYVVDDTGTVGNFTVTSDGAEFDITIVNKSGTVLPSTGGIGTTIFYILGGLLVIGAAVILVARRKAQE